MNRNRSLLDLAHHVPVCMSCERHVEGCEPAHENGAALKGFGCKSNDNRHAALCHECHAWYDQGKGRSPCARFDGVRAEKKEMWNEAHKRTMDYYWSLGWLKVNR